MMTGTRSASGTSGIGIGLASGRKSPSIAALQISAIHSVLGDHHRQPDIAAIVSRGVV
jgi:hypothetical protein